MRGGGVEGQHMDETQVTWARRKCAQHAGCLLGVSSGSALLFRVPRSESRV